MRGTSARHPPKSQSAVPLRNYQLSSLGSNNNVKSIIASMNGSERGKSGDSDKLAGETKKHVVTARVRDQSDDVPRSMPVEGSDNKSRITSSSRPVVVADEGTSTRKRDSLTVKSAAPGNEVRSDSLDNNGQSAVVVVVRKNRNVMASPSNSRSNGNKMDKKEKGLGQCPSSSDDNDDDNDDNDNNERDNGLDDDSEMSSAEESSEELDSSSSSSSDGGSSNESDVHDERGASGNGGLEPISEEQSLRIDLPDAGSSKRAKVRRDKVVEVYEAEQDEDDDDDGNIVNVKS